MVRLLTHLFAGSQPWRHCWLWRRGGTWFNIDPPANRLEAVRRLIAMGPPIAIQFNVAEQSQMIQLVAVHAISGFCVSDDLFIIPDHGRCIVQTDHHGVVRVEAKNGMAALVKHMADTGYVLPEDVLDATFKRPDWMP